MRRAVSRISSPTPCGKISSNTCSTISNKIPRTSNNHWLHKHSMEQELSQSETLRLPFLSSTRGLREGNRWKRSFGLLLSGSLVMLFGSVAVSGLNFAYNVATVRMLGPAEFSHATAATTLLMLCSALTLSFQLVCAKFVARNEQPAGKAKVYRSLMGRAWLVAALLAGALALFERPM